MAAPLASPDPALAERARWRLAEVDAIVEETPHVRGLILRVPGWPGHRPGQHLDVRLTAEDGYQAQRSYSIASPPEEPRLALAVERLAEGEVSSYLAGELRPGDGLELRGPIGGYFAWDVAQGGPLLLVAGGSGVVPLMAMLRHRALAPGGASVPATLLSSSRSFAEILFREELDRLAAADPALRVVQTLTRERPAGWTGQTRRIDREMLAEVAGPPAAGTLAFVCGSTRLVEQVATDLVAVGHDPHRVKTERFGPSGS